LNSFKDDTTNYIQEENSPAVQDQKIAALLFADDVVLGSIIITGLNNGYKKIAKFYEYCSLTCNLKKIKVMVYKKRGKLEKNERCHMEGQRLEEVNEVVYKEVKLEITRSKKQGS
jgi:hypothetical protein